MSDLDSAGNAIRAWGCFALLGFIGLSWLLVEGFIWLVQYLGQHVQIH